jgi:hypothetical protein
MIRMQRNGPPEHHNDKEAGERAHQNTSMIRKQRKGPPKPHFDNGAEKEGSRERAHQNPTKEEV